MSYFYDSLLKWGMLLWEATDYKIHARVFPLSRNVTKSIFKKFIICWEESIFKYQMMWLVNLN